MKPLEARRLRELCAACKLVGSAIEIVEETPSTNDLAKDSLRAMGSSGTAFFAEHQTAGRGQYGRSWSAPKNSSLLFSMALRPPPELNEAGFFIAWSATMICETLARDYSLAAKIKWPNDILIQDRKTAGILVERIPQGVIIGIGINVAISPEQFPDSLAQPATSLQTEANARIDRTELAGRLLCRFNDSYAQCQTEGTETLRSQWRHFLRNAPGSGVNATARKGSFTGILRAIDPVTGAEIAEDSGEIIAIAASDLLGLEAR